MVATYTASDILQYWINKHVTPSHIMNYVDARIIHVVFYHN